MTGKQSETDTQANDKSTQLIRLHGLPTDIAMQPTIVSETHFVAGVEGHKRVCQISIGDILCQPDSLVQCGTNEMKIK